METYTYRPLEALPGLEYRLLILHPISTSQGLLKCSLVHKSLRDQPFPPYETVSYVWGDATNRATICVDGKTLSVPASSELVLRRLALPDKDRTIWLDAVCINQEDLEERARQVLFMKILYRHSTGNVVFLGEEDETSVRAMRNIASIDQDISDETNNFGAMKETIMLDGAWVQAPMDMSTEADADALIALFSRPYFSRVWVVQEVLLSPQNLCICGDQEIPFMSIVRVAIWLYQYHAFNIPRSLYEVPGLENISALWESMTGSRDRVAMPPMSALDGASERDSTDPRDKIFGMLGIIQLPPGNVPALLAPSYTKPVAHVFRDAVRYSMQTHRQLWILRYISHRSEEDLYADFPTWVPRFDRKRGRNQDPALLSFGYRSQTGMKASSNLQYAHVPVGGDPHELLLCGIEIDIVQTLYPIFREEDTSSFWRMCFVLSDRKPDHKRLLTKTLLVERNYRHQKATQADYDMYNDYRAHLGSGPGKTLSNVTSITPDMPENVKRATYFHQAVINATNRRRFAFTKKGNCALVPKLAKEGNVVALMDGGDLPLVLRGVGEKWILLGECYVEGDMASEGLELGLEEREFCIR